MGIYSPEEYFKNLYPGWFTESNLTEIISYVLLFTILMSGLYIYINYFEKRKHEIGDEIYCGKLIKDYTFDIRLRKTMDEEWLAIKINTDTMERTMLRRGDFSKVADYIDRNFGLRCKEG